MSRSKSTWARASRATDWSVPVRSDDEHPAGLVDVVDVGVEAVAVVGELLEEDVVEVAHPDADRDELDAGLGAVPDAAEDRVGVGRADVRDAVRGEDDAVDAARHEGPAGHLVAQLEAGRRVRRAARLERLDGAQDRLAVADRRRLEDDAGVGAVGDDADRCRRGGASRRAARATA